MRAAALFCSTVMQPSSFVDKVGSCYWLLLVSLDVMSFFVADVTGWGRRSGGPAVSEHRKRGEDGDDAGAPEDGRYRVRGDRAPEQQRPDGVDGRGEGLVVGVGA